MLRSRDQQERDTAADVYMQHVRNREMLEDLNIECVAFSLISCAQCATGSN